MPICQHCNKEFPDKITIDDKTYSLSSRRFCLICSPLNARNTRSYIIDLKPDESYCPRCNSIKPRKDFYIRHDSNKAFSYCKSCQIEVKELKLREKLEYMVELHKGCCADCGNYYPTPVFNFYLDNNVYQLSKAKNMSLCKLKAALTDYIMLCHNCCAIRKWSL